MTDRTCSNCGYNLPRFNFIIPQAYVICGRCEIKLRLRYSDHLKICGFWMILSVALVIVVANPFMHVRIQCFLHSLSLILICSSCIPIYFFVRNSRYSHEYKRMNFIKKFFFYPVVPLVIILALFIEENQSNKIEKTLSQKNISYEINVEDSEFVYDRKITAIIGDDQFRDLLNDFDVENFNHKSGELQIRTLRYLYFMKYKEGTLYIKISMRMPEPW